MLMKKVNKVVDFKGGRLGDKGGTCKGIAHHCKPKSGLLHGNGCKDSKGKIIWADCFTCPFPDCVSDR